MKSLIHNTSILALLALMMVGLQSCSDELPEANDVQICFTATLPADTRTRSFGKAEQVNTLVVGVFDEDKTQEIQRRAFPISGTLCDVTFALARNQTYSFVFWAYDANQNIYNIDNLTAIKMNVLPNPITFSGAEAADAFFAIEKDITITGNCSYSVELVRPLAQINVGTTGTSVQATFKAKSVPDTYHPFNDTVSGITEFTWNFSETTNGTFSVEGTKYNYLAMGYVFAPTIATKISAELTLNNGETSKTVEFPQVEIKGNNRSNIAGSFTTQE